MNEGETQRRLDWPGLMRAGLRVLRLEPERFWRLTPVELRMMLGIEAGSAPLTRARLAELAAAFPDLTREETNGYGETGRGTFGAGFVAGPVGRDGRGL
ncbi:rcc01693 family protein [Neotabrizicola shimadae]|uniref:Phage tail assembly chaperone n=1 Tax=Neotabrizicola shimadae TaxID=2807096 RepID=A0A8G1ECQ4_9RHOB|nr:phage tail assembly chaperone [Neotabrizicola shimadae]